MQQSRAGGAASGSGWTGRASAKLAGGGVRHGRSVAAWGRVGKWFGHLSLQHVSQDAIGGFWISKSEILHLCL